MFSIVQVKVQWSSGVWHCAEVWLVTTSITQDPSSWDGSRMQFWNMGSHLAI